MKSAVAAAIGVFVIVLCVPASAPAQEWIRVQGRIHAVDCQNATLALRTEGETRTWPVPSTAAIFAGSTSIGLCTLQQYVGSYAAVAVTPVDNRLVVGRIDVLVGATPPPPYYGYPYYYPYPYYYGPPIGIGIVFGWGWPHHR